MSPQIENTNHAELFSDLVTGSIADAKAKFYKLILQLGILPYLAVMLTRIHSYGRHKPMLLTKITCGTWQTQQARKTTGGRFTVDDPTRFHDVHMEVGVKPGLAKLELLVHHETPTKPYIAEHKLSSLLDAETAANYRRRRKDFMEIFEKECHARGFKFSNRWMLIGSAEYDFSRKTVAEVTAWLTYMIDEVADAINWTMHKLDERARLVAGCGAGESEPSDTQGVLDEGGSVAPIIAEGGAACEQAVSEPSETPALLEERPAPITDELVAVNINVFDDVPFPEDKEFEVVGIEPSQTATIVEEDEAASTLAEDVTGSEAHVNTRFEPMAIIEENSALMTDEEVPDSIFTKEEVPFVAGAACEMAVEDGTTARTTADVIANNSPASGEGPFPVLGESGTGVGHASETLDIVEGNPAGEADVADAIAEVIPASIFTEEEVPFQPES
jgi:hypothetical protein